MNRLTGYVNFGLVGLMICGRKPKLFKVLGKRRMRRRMCGEGFVILDEKSVIILP